MSKGDGSIIQRSKGVWEVQVSLGRDALTGKYRKVSRTVKGTKAEARKIRDQIKGEFGSGLKIEADDLTFGELSAMFHEGRVSSGEAGRTRLDTERRQLDTLNTYLRNVRIKEITPQMIESLYIVIKRDKVKQRGRYSGTTMNQLHGLLKRIMQKAVDYDFILKNPCDKVKAPKKDEPERRSLSVEEGIRLLSCIEKAESEAYCDMMEKEARQTARGNLFGREYLRGLNTVSNVLAVRIGLATGMRRGEVFGLCWGEIDFDRSSVKVRQSLTSYGEVKQPKSKAGTRTIALDMNTITHLKAWKNRQAVELLKIGITQCDATPVYCSEKGAFIDLHNFERWWRGFREQCGFSCLKFHELRHTQATQLLANGVDVKTVQARLGHSNASLTLNWYAHAIPENDQKAAELVGDLFSEKSARHCILELKTA